MHPVRRQRLFLVLFVVLFSSAAVGLMAYALRGNINLFYPPAEVAGRRQTSGKTGLESVPSPKRSGSP